MAAKFAVRRQKPEFIIPAKPTPREIKILSDIDDQQGLRFHYPTIMFYKNNPVPDMRGKDPVRVIKEALAKALVYYYPYAGRLIEGPNKKLLVNCTAEGIVFVEASAEVRLEQLRNVMSPPCPCSEELLINIPRSSEMIDSPLMFVQVTRLQCGGFVFAIGLNHVMSDGMGKVLFLNAVSQIAKGSSSPSPLPVWCREFLTARNPPLPSFVHEEFEVVMNEKDTEMELGPESLIRQSFFFGAKEIRAIKNLLPPHIQSRSKFELITAFLWRARIKALELDENEVVTLTFFLNIRGKNFQELPNGYYGNAVISTAAVTDAKTLCNNPLSYAMKLLIKAKEKVNQDYANSAIDFIALHGKPGFVHTRGAWVVSDSSRVGFHEVDFGWENPIYGGTMDGGSFSYISLYSHVTNNMREVGILTPICLPVSAMHRLKDELRKLIQVPMEKFRQPEHIRAVSML